MTTPNEQNYRTLDPNEVIQEGDEFNSPYGKTWIPCNGSIGETPKDWPMYKFRRLIIDSLRAQLAESEKKRAEAEQKLQVAVGLACIEDYPKDIANDLLAARKEIVELRIRAEKAEGERYEADKHAECLGKLLEVGKALLAAVESERDYLQAELEAIKSASGQFEPHHNFKTVIDGIHHMRHKIGEFTHQITSLQAELAKCREALGAVVEMTDLYRLSPKWREMIEAALEGGK